MYTNLMCIFFSSLGARVMTDNLLLADGQEGVKSFAEKRPPVWKNDFTKTPAGSWPESVAEEISGYEI